MKVLRIGAVGAVFVFGSAGAASVTAGVALLFGSGYAFVAAGTFLLILAAIMFRGISG